MRRYFYLAICLAAVAIGACSKDSSLPVATGKGSIRAINTISTAPEFSVLIEERPIGTAAFKSSSLPAAYDDLEYDFNFEVFLADTTAPTRVATRHLDVVKDMGYAFLITGAISSPTILLWEFAQRDFSDTDTVFEAHFGHTSPSLGSIDVFFAAPGIAPIPGAELGTLAFGEVLPAADFETGDYVVSFTAVGEPGTILFTSNTLTITAGVKRLFSVFDTDANDLAPLSVQLFDLDSGTSALVADANYAPTLRFFHASIGLETVDIYIEDPLGVSLVSGHAFGDFTGDIAVSSGSIPLTYTTALNVGSILIDNDIVVAAGSRTQYYVVRRTTGEDVVVDHRPNRRSIETVARVSVINTSTNHPTVDFYAIAVGTDIADALPMLRSVSLGGDPIQFSIAAGDLDLYLTTLDEKTVLAGPVPLTIALGDIMEFIVYDKVDPAVVDLVSIPLP
jgi:hypothetical protein